jgi:hypothetical protein
MEMKMMITALALLIGGIFSIATSSIGIQCYNSDQKGTDQKGSSPNNFNFLVFNLVSAILMTLIAMASMYFAATMP